MDERLVTVKKKIKRHRKLTPLAPDVLESFEAQHRIRLPEDYRRYLLEVSNGGYGPFCGLFPLEKWDFALPHDTFPVMPADILATPCPLSEGLNTEDWESHLPIYAYHPYQGAVALCHQGCTYVAVLIVSGSLRGRVCNIDQDMLWPPYFAPFPDFLSWYEAWLDRPVDMQGWFGHVYDTYDPSRDKPPDPRDAKLREYPAARAARQLRQQSEQAGATRRPWWKLW